jgi:hypothetical protein
VERNRIVEERFYFERFLRIEEFKAKKEISEVVKSLIDKEKSVFENAFNISKYIFENFTYKQGLPLSKLILMKFGV